MELKGKRIGFGVTGSFCTIGAVLDPMRQLAQLGADLFPIFSPVVSNLNTRFFQAEDLWQTVTQICGRQPWNSLVQVEPIGPKHLLDMMVIAPCTGNTMGKMAAGIVDTPVLMAAKSHLRNAGPVVLAVSTNDGLGNCARNIGFLQNMKNIYFVPYEQDNAQKKPNSLVARMELIVPTCQQALEGRQIQPVLYRQDN